MYCYKGLYSKSLDSVEFAVWGRDGMGIGNCRFFVGVVDNAVHCIAVCLEAR
jgi:hypothetical protein